MNMYKRTAILAGMFILVLNLVACGQVKEDNIVNGTSVNQQGNNMQMGNDSDTKKVEPTNTDEPTTDQQGINTPVDGNSNGNENEPANLDELPIVQQDSTTQVDGDLDEKEDKPANAGEPTMVQQEGNKATVDEILDSFINGSINAIDSTDSMSTFSIADLDMNSEDWDSYSVGEKVDLDNDGENELIICGTYGGIYLDARDGRVYKFAAGEGSALTLSYVTYNGAIWIMYSNRMNAGYESYHMEKFEGADNLAAEMNFSEELVDVDNPEAGTKYILNGTEISYDEYSALGSKIFATEVTTN